MTYLDKYTFHEEQFVDAYREDTALFQEHHDVTKVMDLKMAPDLHDYRALQDSGFYKFVTIRCEGKLIGYAGHFVDEDLHHKGFTQAIQDMLYVRPGHRGIGYAFIKFCDELLVNLGVGAIWRHSTVHVDVSKVYERLGFSFVQKAFVRRVNEPRGK
jgi:GNAT superfamily N-acetyltransferase